MKPRNREINIFNMSLLDILCGALGTFCFMMIVLFPYYTNKPSKAPEVPKDMVDPQTFQQALDQIKQLKDTLDKMQNYSKQLEGQNQQLQQQAAKTNDHVGDLELRNPFMAIIRFDSFGADDQTEIYWDSDRVRSDQNGHPFKLDPLQHQAGLFFGDMVIRDGAVDYHIIRDCPPGQYRLVLKIIKHDPAQPPVQGTPFVHMSTWDNWRYVGPSIKTTKAQVLIPLATVDMGTAPDYQYKLQWTVPKEVIVDPEWKPNMPPPRDQKK